MARSGGEGCASSVGGVPKNRRAVLSMLGTGAEPEAQRRILRRRIAEVLPACRFRAQEEAVRVLTSQGDISMLAKLLPVKITGDGVLCGLALLGFSQCSPTPEYATKVVGKLFRNIVGVLINAGDKRDWKSRAVPLLLQCVDVLQEHVPQELVSWVGSLPPEFGADSTRRPDIVLRGVIERIGLEVETGQPGWCCRIRTLTRYAPK